MVVSHVENITIVRPIVALTTDLNVNFVIDWVTNRDYVTFTANRNTARKTGPTHLIMKGPEQRFVRLIKLLNNKNFLKIEHLNAQSLQGNLEEIKLLLNERDADVLCVRETWLFSCASDFYVNIQNYSMYRCDRGRGSGVCVHVKDHLSSGVLHTNIKRQSGVKDVWVKIQCRKLPSIIIGCIYRHPKAHSDSFDYIVDILRTMSMRNKSLFFLVISMTIFSRTIASSCEF